VNVLAPCHARRPREGRGGDLRARFRRGARFRRARRLFFSCSDSPTSEIKM
jgi:hypothetical protein